MKVFTGEFNGLRYRERQEAYSADNNRDLYIIEFFGIEQDVVEKIMDIIKETYPNLLEVKYNFFESRNPITDSCEYASFGYNPKEKFARIATTINVLEALDINRISEDAEVYGVKAELYKLLNPSYSTNLYNVLTLIKGKKEELSELNRNLSELINKFIIENGYGKEVTINLNSLLHSLEILVDGQEITLFAKEDGLHKKDGIDSPLAEEMITKLGDTLYGLLKIIFANKGYAEIDQINIKKTLNSEFAVKILNTGISIVLGNYLELFLDYQTLQPSYNCRYPKAVEECAGREEEIFASIKIPTTGFPIFMQKDLEQYLNELLKQGKTKKGATRK